MQIKNEIVNFSTNKGVTLKELFDEMSKVYGYKQKPNYLSERIGDIKDSILSNQKTLEMFKKIKCTDYKKGLKFLRESVSR